MYATLETYDLHDRHCRLVKEKFTLPKETSYERRRRQRGGMGIDGCKPYDPSRPYRYMFDSRYNKYPYDPDYKLVDGKETDQQYLNVFSYPSYNSSTRVKYCNAPPHVWQLCDDDY